MLAFSGVWMRLCQVESPLQEKAWLVCEANMVRTFEFVLHFVRCVTVTVSPNQILLEFDPMGAILFTSDFQMPSTFYVVNAIVDSIHPSAPRWLERLAVDTEGCWRSRSGWSASEQRWCCELWTFLGNREKWNRPVSKQVFHIHTKQNSGMAPESSGTIPEPVQAKWLRLNVQVRYLNFRYDTWS